MTPENGIYLGESDLSGKEVRDSALADGLDGNDKSPIFTKTKPYVNPGIQDLINFIREEVDIVFGKKKDG